MTKKNKRSCVTTEGSSGRIRTMNLLAGLLLLMLICFVSGTKAEAATLKIKYGGKTYSYTASQASATIDGDSIDMKGTPGVIINDTCMLSAKDIYASGLGVTYSYDSTTKAITFSQNDITVKMTLNSKTAYINDTKTTCDVAPTQIKFVDAGKTKLYVPARFVAEALGYSYNWNSSSKTAEMKQPFVIKYSGKWIVYKGTQGKVTFDGDAVKLTGMPTIIVDSTALLRASSVFKNAMGCDYTYDKATRTVTIAKDGITITMTINKKTATVNGESFTMDTAARVVYNKSTGKSFIMVPGAFVAKKLGFTYNWNSSTKTSEIKTGTKTYFSQIFSAGSTGQASVTEVTATCTDKTDTLTITGSSSLDISVNETETSNLLLTISNVDTNISGFTQAIENSYYLKNVNMYTLNDTIVLDIAKETECNYYTLKSGNSFKLVLCENANVDMNKSSFQLKFNTPDDFVYDEITTEDMYYKNRFIITLAGDYLEYFNSNPISYNTSIVKKVSVEGSGTGYTDIIVDTYELKGFKITNCGDYIGVDIADPKSIYDKIIVLDAGHGGKDNGASSGKTLEKDLNLSIIYDLAKDYFNSPDSTIKAYWTRSDDTFITLDDRAAFASKIGADVFVSLHMNSATASASGLEVYYYSGNNNKMGSMNSKTMATIFYNQLIDDLNMGKRGVKSAGFAVIKRNTVPSILIELGFISNASDRKKLTDPDFQDFAAQSIYDAAVAMFDAYDTGR